MTMPYLGYGLVISVLPHQLVRAALKKMLEQFRQLVIALVTVSGLLILWDQRDFFCLLVSTKDNLSSECRFERKRKITFLIIFCLEYLLCL